MNRHEKALEAVNRRLGRLRAELASVQGEAGRQFLVQAIMVTLGVGEELNGYVQRVAEHAQRRQATLKQANEALAAQHAESMISGQGLLERLKADPADRDVRKQIDAVRRRMEEIQKTLRHEAHELQRELAPLVAMIDRLADSVRRLCEAETPEALQRMVRMALEQLHELYGTLPGRNVIDPAAWEKAAQEEMEPAADVHDAYARAGYQLWRAAILMGKAASERPPRTGEEAAAQANEAVAARMTEIAGRLSRSDQSSETS